MFVFFCFKQKTAYDMRISDWSSDVCSSDLLVQVIPFRESDRHVRPAPAIEGQKITQPSRAERGEETDRERSDLGAPGTPGSGDRPVQFKQHSTEERRDGQGCVSQCSVRVTPYT